MGLLRLLPNTFLLPVSPKEVSRYQQRQMQYGQQERQMSMLLPFDFLSKSEAKQ